ncbi:MAG TPA: glycosyltransferase family 4 protein [Thermoplasmata archaeon]|nr:glycosyltransferase family 4 protein [Thermoplasmata archaeon]
MRIVQVAPFFAPHTGGVESHVRNLAREFAREGHDVTVVTARYDRHLPVDERVEGYRILRARTLFVAANTPIDPGMTGLLRRLDADVVHLHYPPPLTSYFATRGLANRKVPVCLTYHCDLELPGRAGRLVAGAYQRFFVPPTLRRVNRVVVHTRSYGVTSAMLRGRELAVIPSVVDLERFRPGLDASRLRGELRLEGKRVLAFTGRLVPHKGVNVILEALALLPDDVVLVVIGAGPRLPSLIGMARRLDVEARVRFCPAVSDEELPLFLALADIFVFPSQSRLEGFGLVVAEAMAMGLPVVVADLPGVREIIEPGVEGLLVEPLIASDLAAKVRTMLDDPALARRMGAAGRRRAEARYGLATVAGQLLSLYEDLRAAG